MSRQLIGLTLLLAGLALIGWAGLQMLDGNFSFGSKYTSKGRDSGGIILAMIIGFCASAYGVIELFMARRNDRNDEQ